MQDNSQQNEHVYFINQLYRDFILPTILGNDTGEILYWSGKHIAQKYDLASYEDITSFFMTAQFGVLTLIKKRRSEVVLELSGQNVADRLDSGIREFTLEAGIVAAALEKEYQRTTECELKIDAKNKRVQLTARFD
ncbi:DUF2507 domain-containing protein [Lactobacillus sp. XV13L]|nr:DUF2507 domain-containing protein [Lactobacillus sp. XV13L]